MPFLANIIIISVIAFFVSLVFTVMLLYMLIFPLINKLFKTALPSYNYTFGEDDFEKDDPGEAKADNAAPPSLQGREIPTLRDRLDRAKTPDRQANAAQPISRPRFIDFHKDVPTIKLPDVVAKQKTEELNASKINAAVASTKMERLPKKDESPIKSTPKADTKKVTAKSDTKEAVTKKITKTKSNTKK